LERTGKGRHESRCDGTSRALTEPVDLRFGRTKFFVVVDTGTGGSTVHDNAQNLNAAQGAGIQAAETVARLGAEAVIAGHVGPKAFRALKTAGIKVCLCLPMSVADAVTACKVGKLQEASAANVEGHWA
jgi:predicted Fe-Mo cluster-binding NifX family protein